MLRLLRIKRSVSGLTLAGAWVGDADCGGWHDGHNGGDAACPTGHADIRDQACAWDEAVAGCGVCGGMRRVRARAEMIIASCFEAMSRQRSDSAHM